MAITFDEVVEIIWGNTLGIDASDEPGKKYFIIKDDMVATGRETLTFLIRELKDTYAPTIEMTEIQMKQMMSFKEVNAGFSTFMYKQGLGQVPAFSEFITTKREDELMTAWLHPETIKVVDDGI